MPAAEAAQAPDRLRDWLDGLRTAARMYRVDEIVATWRRIEAPVLLVAASDHSERHRFVETDEYRERLRAIPTLERARGEQAGHMLRHDQPNRVALLIEEFFDA